MRAHTMSPYSVETIAERLLARGQWLGTAESCTGGLIAKTLTDLAGSSAWFERGIVTYSNLAKQQLLGVPEALLDRYGAVSEQVAGAMAEGLLRQAPVDWSIAVTGIAGPGGGSTEKPVGTVWVAWAQRGREAQAQHLLFRGDRAAVRQQTLDAALSGLIGRLLDA